MKLYAQHGAQEGEKINEGIEQNLVDGVVFSPRDVSLENLRTKLRRLLEEHPNIDRLIDPQFYACFLASASAARLGNLVEPEEYGAYLQSRRRNQLERERQITADLRATLIFQAQLDVTGIIAPNIEIPRSFNSIEAAISKNFIRQTGSVYSELNDNRPVFATLAISREALNDKQELLAFLNDITVLEEPPGGFYVLISARGTEARSDIFNADVIAAWMLINHSLRLNGFQVINGYSDVLTPFLGVAGGTAGCAGWWSNLRTFSLERFGPASGGGRLPIPRYLSIRLLNRITHIELHSLRTIVPEILNGLATDALYDEGEGSIPPRNKEVHQSWEALRSLNEQIVSEDQLTGLRNSRNALNEASLLYDEIAASLPIALDPKSNRDHLESLMEGIKLFAQLAEVNFPED